MKRTPTFHMRDNDIEDGLNFVSTKGNPRNVVFESDRLDEDVEYMGRGTRNISLSSEEMRWLAKMKQGPQTRGVPSNLSPLFADVGHEKWKTR